ncbi:LutC/YkgG family protein [Luteipulveratus mongoliensis]|uniref:Lactate utilization protein C n=1 Tax=Luteipulveratus mongoliensis TaxID=571913 RepID=A0A0K1JG14_9MICO|nr:LUD domain-containing protein [Luteipulveratus mongoliensis]AKU15641.1 lactate utilization protein C [Luteipulveratus mongoliensis]
MTSREGVLGAVRRALTDAVEAPAPLLRKRTRDQGDASALFVERVEDYGATVTRCAADEVVDTIRAALPAEESYVVPAGLPWDLPDGVPDDDLSWAALDQVRAVVTTATVAIAETGTLVLDHGAGQGRRAISLLPDLHVCIVRADQIVADVPDATSVLDPTRPQTWISGGSATSDIELQRVEGVHGPRTLHVVLIDE